MTGVTQHLCINTSAATVMLLGPNAPDVEEAFLVSGLDLGTAECDSARYKYVWPFGPASRISSSSSYSTRLRELICPTVTCILQSRIHKHTHTHAPTRRAAQALAEASARNHIHFRANMKPGWSHKARFTRQNPSAYVFGCLCILGENDQIGNSQSDVITGQ